MCTHHPPVLPFAFIIVPWHLISLFVNTLPRLLLSISTCVYENKIYYVSMIKYTIQKRPTSTQSKEHVTLAIGIKKLCRAQNVPGLVFALIASHSLAAGVHVAWALYWHSLWCWCWYLRRHASCWHSCRHPSCWHLHGCLLLCWCLCRCLSCCHMGI